MRPYGKRRFICIKIKGMTPDKDRIFDTRRIENTVFCFIRKTARDMVFQRYCHNSGRPAGMIFHLSAMGDQRLGRMQWLRNHSMRAESWKYKIYHILLFLFSAAGICRFFIKLPVLRRRFFPGLPARPPSSCPDGK